MHIFRLVLMVCLAAGMAQPAFARSAALTPFENTFAPTILPSENIVSEEKPVVLTADHVDYFQEENVVIASGKVEIAQGNTLLLCDKLVYDRARDHIEAKGNVSVMDETGSVMFADEVELRDQFRMGVIEQFKARLTDDSIFAATQAVRENEHVLRLKNAVYSPCKVKCASDLKPGEEPQAPLWQLRAEHVKIDEEAQVVTYDNAWMDLYGVPVFYTPYLSHATPNADGKAGMMAPEFERNRNLGNVYRVPFYYPFGADKDITLTPVYTSKEGWLLFSDYRQRYDTGRLDIDGSITHPRDRDAAGDLTEGRQWRGHVYALGDFDADDTTKWGFDIKRTSDDTYLRKYSIDGGTLLTSRVYGERYHVTDWSDRNSFSAEALAFQGLAATDDSKKIPLILPLVNFDYESDPGAYGGRYFMNNNALLLTRDTGAETRRLSNTIGWRLPYISDGGQWIEFNTQLRGDIYDERNVLLSNGQNFDGVTGRLIPQASVLWRYPFINQFDGGSINIEPVVEAAVSPNGGNPEKISNEDSLVPEFTDTNLFSDNRFAGYDRVEHGPRASYGLRGLINYQQTYVDWLVGQHYRVEADRNFPFSNDLDDHLSDYVGKVGLQVNPLYIAYRFRLDKQSLSARRQEMDVSYVGRRFQMNAAYLLLQNDPILASREELATDAYVTLTQNWIAGVNVRNDLEIDQLTSVGGQLIYKNECVSVASVINREYTRDREVKPSTKYLIRVSLKNLN